MVIPSSGERSAFHGPMILPRLLPCGVDRSEFQPHSACMSNRSIFATRYYFSLFAGGG